MRTILRSSDFSNIEGRVIAWLAGQEDKLGAFKAYDAGTGPDLYLVAASLIFNVHVKEAKPYRQIGKVAELALGFQGGPRAFAKMAKNYGVRIAQQYEGIWANVGEEFKEQALAAWDARGRKTGMSREAWLASEVVKLGWRAANSRISAYWSSIEAAAIEAVKKEGEIIEVVRWPLRGEGDYWFGVGPMVKFRKVGSFLFCMLPSGRALTYPYPRIREKETPWGGKREQLVFKAIDQFTKKWGDKAYYGGIGVENITQAVARDIMAEAMLRVDKAGYSLVLTVHDEIITEDTIGFGSMDEFNAIMTEVPVWAKGLPISVGGWEGARYRKG